MIPFINKINAIVIAIGLMMGSSFIFGNIFGRPANNKKRVVTVDFY